MRDSDKIIPRTASFAAGTRGIGMHSLELCWYCKKPSPKLGGKYSKPLRLFRCAKCVQGLVKES